MSSESKPDVPFCTAAMMATAVVLARRSDSPRRRNTPLGVVASSLTLGASKHLPVPRLPGWSAGSTSDVGGHDVRRVAVQGYPGPVVTHRGPRISV